MSDREVPPGWYPDPDGKPSERYWDGLKWTSESRPFSVLTGKPKPQSKSTGLDSNEKLILVFILVAIIIVIFSLPA